MRTSCSFFALLCLPFKAILHIWTIVSCFFVQFVFQVRLSTDPHRTCCKKNRTKKINKSVNPRSIFPKTYKKRYGKLKKLKLISRLNSLVYWDAYFSLLNRQHKNAATAENEEFFEKYIDLPPELRMMIIDEMGTEDRCRFTRCSKLCNKEARSSKNYIHSLKFLAHDEDTIQINVAHNKYDDDDERDFALKFEKRNDKKWMIYDDYDKELWVEELGSSTDLVQYAAEYFKNLLGKHQHIVKELFFCGDLFFTELKDYDFEIENLNSIKRLNIDGNMDFSLCLSKVRRPMDALIVFEDVNNISFENSEQIYKVRNCIYMPKTKFSNEQFLQLSAPIASIHIGDLTAHDIFKFIRSWQNGTVGKEISAYEWKHLEDSNFDIIELFKLFGKNLDENAEWGSIEVKQNNDAGNVAEIRYYNMCGIRFEVRRRRS